MCSTMQSKRRRKRKSPKESKASTEIQPFPNSGGAGVSAALPLSQDRSALSGRATAYVCQNSACQLPVHTPEKLRAQLLQPSLD